MFRPNPQPLPYKGRGENQRLYSTRREVCLWSIDLKIAITQYGSVRAKKIKLRRLGLPCVNPTNLGKCWVTLREAAPRLSSSTQPTIISEK
jgi:hypothetical protein